MAPRPYPLWDTERGRSLPPLDPRLSRSETDIFDEPAKTRTRDACSTFALLDLKKFVDEATQTTHTAELEAISLAISPSQGGDNLATL